MAVHHLAPGVVGSTHPGVVGTAWWAAPIPAWWTRKGQAPGVGMIARVGRVLPCGLYCRGALPGVIHWA